MESRIARGIPPAWWWRSIISMKGLTAMAVRMGRGSVRRSVRGWMNGLIGTGAGAGMGIAVLEAIDACCGIGAEMGIAVLEGIVPCCGTGGRTVLVIDGPVGGACRFNGGGIGP